MDTLNAIIETQRHFEKLEDAILVAKSIYAKHINDGLFDNPPKQFNVQKVVKEGQELWRAEFIETETNWDDCTLWDRADKYWLAEGLELSKLAAQVERDWEVNCPELTEQAAK